MQLSWSPDKVRPPAVFPRHDMHPKATMVMIRVVWIRYTILTVEMIEFLDKYDLKNCVESIQGKVNGFCMQLEELVAEWDMETRMKDPLLPHLLRCFIADHIMNIYTIIIGVKRLAKSSEIATVDPITLRAARKVVSTLLYFESSPELLESTKFIFTQYVPTILYSH